MRTTVEINSQRLVAFRRKSKLAQKELAGKLGVDTGTVSRWERGEVTRLRQSHFGKLCEALGVTVSELCADGPLPEPPNAQSESAKGQMTVMIDTAARNAMALVAKRYGVTRQQIIEAAPLLFFIAAEQCLQDRQHRLAAFTDALNSAQDARPPHMNLDFYDIDDEALEVEEKSIRARDLFGAEIAAASGAFAEDEETENPFARFLSDWLAEAQQNRKAVVGWGHGDSPRYYICPDEVLSLVGGDKEAASLILKGIVALHEMPTEVRRSSAEEKATWVRAQYQEMLRSAEPSEFPDLETLFAEVEKAEEERKEEDRLRANPATLGDDL